jgi:hypothetical protein
MVNKINEQISDLITHRESELMKRRKNQPVRDAASTHGFLNLPKETSSCSEISVVVAFCSELSS